MSSDHILIMVDPAHNLRCAGRVVEPPGVILRPATPMTLAGVSDEPLGRGSLPVRACTPPPQWQRPLATVTSRHRPVSLSFLGLPAGPLTQGQVTARSAPTGSVRRIYMPHRHLCVPRQCGKVGTAELAPSLAFEMFYSRWNGYIPRMFIALAL